MSRTEEGVLVLSDITGYTTYVASTELEHSQEILTELLELLVNQFRSFLKIVKLEGDAVFAYSSEEQSPYKLKDLIETTYYTFRLKVTKMHELTTCTCDACKMIPKLDLKFFVHYGKYVIQNVSGIKELIGFDVNLLHRLTKNSLSIETGWSAYILFTLQFIEKINSDRNLYLKVNEKYDDPIGEIETFNINLQDWFSDNLNTERIRIYEKEAHSKISYKFKYSRSVVWQWINDMDRKSQIDKNYKYTSHVKPNGKLGVGATNHCAHGKGLSKLAVETILDWKPFDYYTCDFSEPGEGGLFDIIMTIQLNENSNNETMLNGYLKFKKELPVILGPILKYIFCRNLKSNYIKLEKIMNKTLEK